ncbi:peptidoglycan DD-metalloendopeptidase family protein [Pseudomonas sp. LS44]|uniref:peptidoglycan DD-metalloendopeptidase family protein n=1 Tax=Pseudomonas sp. LS44 TaxID=1357074 RepID=UPI00215A3A6E|nr:peptidoglycan DD-metalloendopeptidase family protein [Pseudomonas sp. LS44]UVE16661.1 peptidoglycan DD-metalloendopeptidase family protein [Pseudomonas sp. LS44]
MSLTVIQQRIRIVTARSALSGLALVILLSGCSSSPSNVQVVERGNNRATAAPSRPAMTSGQYVVQRGDTLYSIAFRYGWDWKALAARNNIPQPYTIHVGQAIRFDGRSQSSSAVAVVKPAARQTPAPVSPLPPSRPAVAQAPVVVAPAQTPVQSVTRSASGWAWPAAGNLIGRFSSNGSLNKGIDIAGELGQPVLAASDGSVVYAGSGLRGYGELVIIKHSDTYVSAYGHNRRLLVREGQQVKVGQTIAEMGSTGADRVKLHFEIRRQGKPVDPLQYLPNR